MMYRSENFTNSLDISTKRDFFLFFTKCTKSFFCDERIMKFLEQLQEYL